MDGLSRSGGFASLVFRTSQGRARAFSLAARRTRFETSAEPGFGDDATLAARSCVLPVGASLSPSRAPRRFTIPVRASVRRAGGFRPTPQPHCEAWPPPVPHDLPLAAERSAAPTGTRRFASTRPRWRQSNGTPNHALQRTAPGVTACAPTRRPAPAAFPHRLRRPPQSLSLGSLDVATSLLSNHAFIRASSESIPVSQTHALVSGSFTLSPHSAVWRSERSIVSACPSFSPSAVSPVPTDSRF